MDTEFSWVSRETKVYASVPANMLLVAALRAVQDISFLAAWGCF